MSEAPEQQDPSMEEILASIRKIISDDDVPEDGAVDLAADSAPEEAVEPEPEPESEAVAEAIEEPEVAGQDDIDALFDGPEEPAAPEEDEDVLELTEVALAEQPVEEPVQEFAPANDADPLSLDDLDPPADEPQLVSADAAQEASAALRNLSGLLVRDYPGAEKTLEGVVRDMLRPLLKAWLDEHLPEVVERMVEKEIERISRRS